MTERFFRYGWGASYAGIMFGTLIAYLLLPIRDRIPLF